MSKIAKPVNPLEMIGTLTLNWLVPGSGWALKGDRAIGLALFATINSAFLIGMFLQGAVIWPPLNEPGTDAVNWVNVLTFAGQLGNGGFCGLHLLLERAGALSWYAPESASADVAALYFLVSGSMNYFSTCGLYDRHFAPERPESDPNPAESESPADPAGATEG